MIPNFKDQLAADVQSVFLASDEFATVHIIDDREVRVVIESDQEGTHIYNAHPPSYAGGASVHQIIFFVDPLEMQYRPENDQQLAFDERLFTVRGVADDDGLYKVTIERSVG